MEILSLKKVEIAQSIFNETLHPCEAIIAFSSGLYQEFQGSTDGIRQEADISSKKLPFEGQFLLIGVIH